MHSQDTTPDDLAAKRAAKAAYMREWRNRNLERERAKERERRQADPERFQEYSRQGYWRNRETLLGRSKAKWTEKSEQYNAQRRARRAANHEAVRAVERAWREAHPEKVRQFDRNEWVAMCAAPEKRDRERERGRQWREGHADELTDKRRAEYQAKRTEIDARLKAFREADPERYRKKQAEAARRRRARLAAVEVGKVDFDAISERDGGRCGICGKKVARSDASLDHIVPVSKGGPHVPSNVQLAQLRCNQSRSTKGPGQLRLAL